MEIRPRLLEHPFYQAWTRGELSVDQLSRYHRGYARFLRHFPTFWQTVIDAFPSGSAGAQVVRDEQDHVDLWERWGAFLPAPADAPDMQETVDAFCAMNPSRLLGAIHAFEVQQPEVAQTKIAGLLRHYRVPAEALVYFDEHLREERHIAFGLGLAARFADAGEFAEGVRTGASVVYASLDKFIQHPWHTEA